MVKPDGDTHLNITFNYYLDGKEQEIRCKIQDIDYTSVEDLLEYISLRTNLIQLVNNEYTSLGQQVKFNSVSFHLKNITPYIEN